MCTQHRSYKSFPAAALPLIFEQLAANYHAHYKVAMMDDPFEDPDMFMDNDAVRTVNIGKIGNHNYVRMTDELGFQIRHLSTGNVEVQILDASDLDDPFKLIESILILPSPIQKEAEPKVVYIDTGKGGRQAFSTSCT